MFDRLTYRHRYEKLVKQVGRDALTGLQDRGRFDTKGPAMLQTASRSSMPASLMMIDIDRFKEINDQYGHPVGDRVLCNVATMLASVKRESDELFRYGGEEFSLLCPDLPAESAMAAAERIRAAVSSTQHADLDQPVTISIGVASFPAQAQDFATLLARADAALYQAKALGRDRVCHADLHPIQTSKERLTAGLADRGTTGAW
ncbi:GGDEF domain-containing protein [Azorhizophilus paspali]|uniref:GGDEF domain-containing protein n=1 Tax=Azorhizophilus paspali TaxID=69963 RepID=UPI003637B76C